MPRQVLLALAVESCLIAVTLLMLLQPRALFPTWSPRGRRAAKTSGWVLLCMTFCWSVILGAILALHRLTFLI